MTFNIWQLYGCRNCTAKGLRVRILKGLLVVSALMMSALPALSAELVMYRRAGCPYCETWDREIGPIYPKTDIGKTLPLRQVHLDRGKDNSVALKSPVRFTPTFVLVEDGKEKARIEGYPGDFFFWARLEKLML
jgi:thioredoxin-related protein